MAEIGNSAVFSQTDSSNNSGTVPTFAENQAASQVNDSARALQGAITREWNWRNPTLTTTGSSNAYVLTFSVAPAALYHGQIFGFKTNFANTGTATLNINTLGAKTIKKVVTGTLTALASADLASGAFCLVAYNSSDDSFVLLVGLTASTTASTTEVLTGTDTSKSATPDAIAALWEKGSNVASAGTISLGEGGYFHITGTTTITDIDFATAKDGRWAICVFDGALTLTHNATTLILPGGANITTAAGDIACFIQDNSDNVQCAWYQRVATAPIVAATQAVMEAATSAVAMVVPSVQHNHPGHPKFWGFASVSSGTPTLQVSYNVTSITDTAVGRLTITIATDFSSANWAFAGVATSAAGNINSIQVTSQAAGSIEVQNVDNGAALRDPGGWHAVGLGDHA